jgi:hypothetical protein
MAVDAHDLVTRVHLLNMRIEVSRPLPLPHKVRLRSLRDE